MKIIGIYGGSGAGKSTVTKGLVQVLPNCTYINPGRYAREATEYLQNTMFSKLGLASIDPNISKSNYIFSSYESMTIWIDVIKEKVISEVEKYIEENKSEKEYIIVDWCFLPMCDFYKKCDYTLCVKTDYDIRYQRLECRMKNVETFSILRGSPFSDYSTKSFENRLKYTALEQYGYKSQYEFENNGTMEVLNQFTKDFAAKITGDSKYVGKFFKI